MKKKLILITIFLTLSISVLSASEIYPLKNGEILLDKQIISEEQMNIFTQYEGEYYKKMLQKEDGIWIEILNGIVQPISNGLKEDKNIKTNYVVKVAVEDNLKASGYSLGALPLKLDYSNLGYFPPIGNQLENSCVGWATGYYLRTFQQAKDIGWEVGNNTKHIFSPSYIYNQINDGIDEGASLQSAGNLLKDQGAAALYDFPYVAKDYLTQPSGDIIQKSAPNKIKDWYVLYTYNDSSDYIIQKTKEYLNTGDLPVVGINVGFKWMYPLIKSDGTSIVTTENYTLGGHAVVVVGYDDTLETPEGYGAFKIINSYGENWGQSGYTYITYAAFAKAIQAGFIFTDLINGRIVDEEEIDLSKVVKEELEIDVQDTVDFKMEFTGSGRYDLRVKDENGSIINEITNNKGSKGLNIYNWNGKDVEGNITPYGNYNVEITPYKGNQPKASTSIGFVKKAKLVTADAQSYKLFESTYKVEVNLKAKESGKVTIYFVKGDIEEVLIQDYEISEGETKAFSVISSSTINLNDENLSIKVIVN
ncbi:FlgD immunoglobulin-like domain containing protein [Clostridium sp.]|uniref:FlgD immunoglobulin-like domain containing protein n=1 Tax=Clostridium sp. TaxID=1506 RepID=UPI003EED76CA